MIKNVLKNPVKDGKCPVSSVTLAKLAATEDVRTCVECENGNLLKAVYNKEKQKLKLWTKTAQGSQTVEIQFVHQPFSHPVSQAEAKMCELDQVAIHAPDGKIVLIGDSLFHNWPFPDIDMGMSGEVINFGVGGYCISDLDRLIVPRLVLPINPSHIIVHVGINDMFQAGIPLETYLGDIIAFFEKLHRLLPEAELCFLTIVRPTDTAPTVTGLVGPEADARRDNIDRANLAMKEFCKAHDYAAYLDAEAAYCDQNGRSIVADFHEDGIHLIPDAYPAWGKAIAEAFRKI